MVKVADSKLTTTVKARPKAEDGNPRHIAAPMPGVVGTVVVQVGQQVRAGETLMTIEAMKMETAIIADRAGRIESIAAPVGSQVDVKDLLLVLAD